MTNKRSWHLQAVALLLTSMSWISDVVADSILNSNMGPGMTPTLPEVDLGYVKYRGHFDYSTNLSIFHSIPYAQPPLGALRFKAPVPIDLNAPKLSPQQPIINASLPGPMCINGHPAWEWLDERGQAPPVVGREDCLTLDILTPSGVFLDGKVKKKVPVIIKIHGGGYTMGSSDWHNGLYLLPHAKDDMVLVAIQYRLGPFGFLGGEDVRKQGGTSNAGLLDQRTALEWVRRHIGKFGGDPENVTIWGGSAGGGSVTAQMMMYGGEKNPPFKKTIGEYPWWQPYHGEKVLDAQFRQLLTITKCSDLACLRKVNETQLGDAAQESYLLGYNAQLYGYGDFYYGPSVDGEVLLGLPSEEFSAGRFTNVPMLSTRDRFEGYTFSNKSTTSFEKLVVDLHDLLPTANDPFIKNLLALYPEAEYNSTFWRRQALFGDMFVNCPSTWLLEGVNAKHLPNYKLIFDAGNQKHAATDGFLFGSGMNETITEDMRDWYLSFVIHSDPNKQSWSKMTSAQRPTWPEYGKQREVLTISDRDIGTEKDLDIGSRCDFWHDNSRVTRNRIVLQDTFVDASRRRRT